MDYPVNIAPFIPRWTALIIMPIGFLSIAFHMINNSYSHFNDKAILFIFVYLLIILITNDFFQESSLFMYFSIGLIFFSLYKGAPIFTALGGLAILFFWRDWTPLSAISAETYRIVASPTLPTIPLFTLSGYLLAESNASERLVRLFRASFGWIPGGTPIVLVLVCGFFTALTGGSGVTILALGGLLMPILIKEGYSKDFSLGFITVAGSLGLLFPPSLPLIIYGVTAGVSIKLVFLAGIIPGLIRVGMIGGWAIWQGKVQSISKEKFNLSKIISALNDSKWEAIIPIMILFGIFGGFTTLVETASLITIYIFCLLYTSDAADE